MATKNGKRVFKKIQCACGRKIGKNAIRRHRSTCPIYWRQRAIRAERKAAKSGVSNVFPASAPVVTMRSDEEE